ncbi:hypothetical protein PFICI_01053 [Pestalotiopsis fici W106-1]|uniref:Uncharacterized protein n=1 Tax=Pestalotiopsis fici (strain W106-1 / CGMCC3.15140) TaxID=1229662 RepID=W3XMR9_PESFW|nr:uncharacterized protein PFICI_01053 [Pestalotiopsis fici W106-1]ETS87225.1 hypothetical protein PFICI_01053 [Pestalotiopsis fici W106-1]
MEAETPNEGGRRRDRLMGKMFGKQRTAEKERERQYKTEQSANDLSAFLGNSDRLQVTHPPPPPPVHGHRDFEARQPQLALDTSRAMRYPGALDVGNDGQQLAYRSRSHSPPRNRKNKGLVVRFADSYPEVIGEGGDECETIVAEIGRRKRSKSAPLTAPSQSSLKSYEHSRQGSDTRAVSPRKEPNDFVPGPMKRTQTGFSTIGDEPKQDSLAPNLQASPQPRTLPAGEVTRSRFLETSDRKDEARRSFIEIHQYEQRQAEGMAFAQARSASTDSHQGWDEGESSPEPVRTTQPRPPRDLPTIPIMPEAPQLPPAFTGSSERESSPSPFRAQSTRKPQYQPMRHEDRPPMRALSTRTHIPPLMEDHTQPQQPPMAPPPRNPTRRSPLPPVSPSKNPSPSSLEYPRKSPLPPISTDVETPPAFANEVPSARASEIDELRLGSKIDSDSPSSTYSGSIYSTSDMSHKATPITQNPRDRGWSASADKAPRKLSSQPPENEGAYDEFIARTKHLYELFRLHAEQFKSLGSSKPDDMCRAALWWFLKGRIALETAMRSRGQEADETKSLMNRYQAYTDLTKSYWLTEVALPEIADGKFSTTEGEIAEVRQVLATNLKKLAGSMKRNALLPPEEPFMPQMMDKSIWIEYPVLSQDIISLLNGNWGSLLVASQQSAKQVPLVETLPLGDSPTLFNYGRVKADVYLMEQGLESMHTHFSCMLSINRQQKDSTLMFTVASQNGTVTLCIQADKNAGPSWDNVKWRTDKCSLELKMPRGFMVAIQCSQTDFRMLWNIFDFNAKVQSYLYPRKEEVVAFQSKLRGFHYFDSDPQGRTFPKEPVGQCEIGLYEKLLKEGSPTGPRTFHRGFRLAIVTGPRTRTLSGVTHLYPPSMPIQYAYLRGEQREPMIQLSYNDGKAKARMVLIFNDDKEREKFISLLKGSYVHSDEEVVTEVPIQGFSMTEGLQDTKASFPALQRLPWQHARIINDRYAGDVPPVVLAEKLRLELNSIDAKGASVGTIVDRVNMAPGEFKIRLGTKDILTLHVIRNPQVDLTTSVLDRPGLTDAPREFATLQSTVARSPTVRTYRFNSFKDLHAFQNGMTGYTVVFDGVASSLNITRRRMVVPVHKKWESGTARIQVAHHALDGTVQLLAFFEDWIHGHCMGFVLKGTDVYEASGKMGKAAIKFVEAKFPLPKGGDGGEKRDEDRFLCLDMPDYAGEHDDISIVFEDEGERDKLCAVLPAPVKGARLSKLGR